jgi:hypothetical protein
MMTSRRTLLTAVSALLAAGTFGGAGMALANATPTPAPPPPPPATSQPCDALRVRHRHRGVGLTRTATMAQQRCENAEEGWPAPVAGRGYPPGAPDSDNVQDGDQGGSEVPDAPGG